MSPSRHDLERLAAGGLTGLICRAIVQPLDVIKIRFQLQIEPIDKSAKSSKYKSIRQTIRTMMREEGLSSFWKGHTSAQLLSISYTSVQFSTYHLLTETHAKLFSGHFLPEDQPATVDLAYGSLSGMTATLASHPFDTIRTRLVGQGEPKIYSSSHDALKQVMRHEGFKGLYKGLKPNLILVAPQAGCTFFSYKVLKRLYKSVTPEYDYKYRSTSFWFTFGNVLCGAGSGVFAKTIVYPLDSIKKRLQVQGFELARVKFGRTYVYYGLTDCLMKIVKREGILGLFKGYTPSLYKAAFTTALNFSLYEFFTSL